MTTLGIKVRLGALGLAIALVGAAILILFLGSQEQVRNLKSRLSEVDSESFGIADRFQDALRNLQNTMLRYGSVHDPTLWEHFQKASQTLDVWIDDQRPKLTSQHEKDLLHQIDVAYDDYLHAARVLHDAEASPRGPGASLAEFNGLLDQFQRLAGLGQDLARAHYNSRNEVLANAGQTLRQLRLSGLAALGLLFCLSLALAFGVYRHMVTPLRVKLVENKSLLERQEKLASLGLLAAGVAHEIRNPLTAIKAAVFIQRKKFQPGTPEHADAQVVEREILRLERIVNDFLQFARPVAPEMVVLPVSQPLEEVNRLFAPQLAKANIRLLMETPPRVQIRADPAQLKQVLINLVQNAADSIGSNGSITLRARQERARLANGETRAVILEVADTGKGMPPEVEKRLFDPFFTTKDKGTGLGLCIAARIVAQHGGALRYQTQPNRGTTFGIVLPEATA